MHHMSSKMDLTNVQISISRSRDTNKLLQTRQTYDGYRPSKWVEEKSKRSMINIIYHMYVCLVLDNEKSEKKKKNYLFC